MINIMKKILLKPGPVLSNRMEITVMDFPGDIAEGTSLEKLEDEARKRCSITVEYGRPDVMELVNQGMDFDGAIDHYSKHIYSLVKFHILSEWEAVGGLDESLEIVREKIKAYWDSSEQS